MNYKAQKRIDAVRLGKSDTLELGGLDLTQLPEEVYTLTNLRVLSVVSYLLISRKTSIDLFKQFPSDDSQELLKQLEEAEHDLENDLLVPKHLQSIDPRISQLTSLEILDLQYNRLERLPDSIGTLLNLRRLILRENMLTALPGSLSQLTSLELLDIRDNPIQSIPKLPQLEKYDVYKKHFYAQKHEAVWSKDIDLAIWFQGKQTEYGLLK